MLHENEDTVREPAKHPILPTLVKYCLVFGAMALGMAVFADIAGVFRLMLCGVGGIGLLIAVIGWRISRAEKVRGAVCEHRWEVGFVVLVVIHVVWIAGLAYALFWEYLD